MTDLCELTRLADSGRLPPPAAVAARVRARGIWLYVETWLLASRTWVVSLLIVAVLEPIVYLLALGWGLGSLVDRQVGVADGVPYLVFVGPALIVATGVMAAHQESTYPVMAGFKWRRLFLAAQATRAQRLAAADLVVFNGEGVTLRELRTAVQELAARFGL